ncbi:uncharacterized protein LOC130641337 isoform X2 [Hydractinia symbiolongicarpus]|nr:uncharacterized protein LOC130641337 isoform X2 [Hydractinia symbiolongicarpus]
MKESHHVDCDDDDIDEEVKQVDVSHGSTSNQTRKINVHVIQLEFILSLGLMLHSNILVTASLRVKTMKESHHVDCDDDDIDDEVKQVEVSHGSTSNQTSMYASSSSYETSSTFCCDLIYVVVLLASLVFLILFLYGHLPHISTHFSGGKNQHEKIVVLVVCVAFTVLVLLVFIVRCVRRARYSSCHGTVESIWYKHRRRIPTDASFFRDDESAPIDGVSSPQQQGNCDGKSKLDEFSESELRDLKKILTNFTNYHDGNDWCFSPSSHSALSRKSVLGTSPLRPQQRAKLKFTVKVVLVGPPNVGKTSIFHRILYDRFTEYYMATLGADLGHSSLHIFPREFNNHLDISLHLWDIAGSERFSELSHIVYKDATSFVIVCDVTSPSFTTVTMPWIKEIERLLYEPRVSLLFNKIDLHQKMATISYMDDELLQFDSYSVSAKTGERVLDAMVQIIAKSVLHEVDKLL